LLCKYPLSHVSHVTLSFATDHREKQSTMTTLLLVKSVRQQAGYLQSKCPLLHLSYVTFRRLCHVVLFGLEAVYY
jgi:arginine/ornithine N-succinyltransferase beta subunit